MAPFISFEAPTSPSPYRSLPSPTESRSDDRPAPGVLASHDREGACVLTPHSRPERSRPPVLTPSPFPEPLPSPTPSQKEKEVRARVKREVSDDESDSDGMEWGDDGPVTSPVAIKSDGSEPPSPEPQPGQDVSNVFTTYAPQKLRIGRPHPGRVVETSVRVGPSPSESLIDESGPPS